MVPRFIPAEGANFCLGGAILRFAAGGPPESVGRKGFVEFTAVVVDEIVAAVDDFLGDEVGGAFGLCAVGFAGVEAVHAFVVHRIDVRDFLLEGLNVDERNEDDGAGDLRGVESGDEFFDGDDGNIFSAVSAGDEREDSSGLRAVDDDDGDAGGGVDGGRNFESARGFFAGGGGSGADSEAGLGMNDWTDSEKKSDRNQDQSEHMLSAYLSRGEENMSIARPKLVRTRRGVSRRQFQKLLHPQQTQYRIGARSGNSRSLESTVCLYLLVRDCGRRTLLVPRQEQRRPCRENRRQSRFLRFLIGQVSRVRRRA